MHVKIKKKRKRKVLDHFKRSSKGDGWSSCST